MENFKFAENDDDIDEGETIRDLDLTYNFRVKLIQLKSKLPQQMVKNIR